MDIYKKNYCLICGAQKSEPSYAHVNCFAVKSHFYSYDIVNDKYLILLENLNGFTLNFFKERKIKGGNPTNKLFQLNISGSANFEEIIPSIKEFLIHHQNHLILE